MTTVAKAGNNSMTAMVKMALVPVIFHLSHAYIRYFPFSMGKTWVWENLWNRIATKATSKRVVKTVYGIKMRVQPPDQIQTKILFTGRWEPVISRYFVSQLRPGDVFIDVGANVGHHTLLAAKAVGPSGKVYAFEASPSIYEALVHNIALNSGLSVVAVNKAVSAGPGTLDLWLASDFNIGHSTTVSQLATEEGMKLEARVEADSLDNLVPKHELFGARMIKIDVEGAEREVLEPLVSQMSNFSEKTEWLLELAPAFFKSGQKDADWIFQLFRDNGYYAYLIPNIYTLQAYVEPTDSTSVVPLDAPPTGEFNDVLFSKRVITTI